MQAVSWERKPEREPEPYWMANLVPLATKVLEADESYLACTSQAMCFLSQLCRQCGGGGMEGDRQRDRSADRGNCRRGFLWPSPLGGDPEVAGASVKDDLELLRGGSDGDLAVVPEEGRGGRGQPGYTEAARARRGWRRASRNALGVFVVVEGDAGAVGEDGDVAVVALGQTGALQAHRVARHGDVVQLNAVGQGVSGAGSAGVSGCKVRDG